MPSETNASAQARSDAPNAAIRAQLERILASEVFSRSRHLRRFLSFIVDQALAGQGHSLKESVLAHELYGKATDFDGGTDPVVRVDARRLRDKLRECYEGQSDPVVISLPKGSYVPVFEGNSASPTHTAPAIVLIDPRRSDSGHLADVCRRRPSYANDPQRRLRPERIARRPVPVLSRSSSCEPGDRGCCQADARACRWRTGGTGARARSAVSVVGHGHWDRVRHPRARLRCDRCVPVQRSPCCSSGPAGISRTGGFRNMAVSRDGRWALATRMVRFDTDLMRLDNFR